MARCYLQRRPTACADRLCRYAQKALCEAPGVVDTILHQGSAFYLYGVIPEFNDTIRSAANYSYFIDGDLVGTFTLSPSDRPIFHYDFVLYANSSIPNGTHQFSMQNGQNGDTTPSLALLDYAVYTTLVRHIFQSYSHTKFYDPATQTASPRVITPHLLVRLLCLLLGFPSLVTSRRTFKISLLP